MPSKRILPRFHKLNTKSFLIFFTFAFYYLLFGTIPTKAQNSAATPPVAAAGVIQLQDTIARIIALASSFAFIALIIMFVYAGIRFITSNGEPKNIQSAQQIVTWAVIGAAFLVLAWLVLLIIGNFTGLTLTNLCFNFGNCS